jgi:hypothetical protein
MGEKDLSRRELLAATGAVVTAAVGTGARAEAAQRPDEREPPRPAPQRAPAVMLPGKIYVITDVSGQVIGTAHIGPSQGKDGPVPLVPRPVKPGHRVHELDHTPELQKLKAEDLHRAVAKLIRK